MKRRILAFFILLILTGLTVGMKLATSPTVDQWLQRVVLEQLEKRLQVRASLGGFEKNLLMTRVTFNQVTLTDLAGSGKSITTKRLVVEIDPYAFLRGTLYLKSIQLEGVFLNITRKLDGSVTVEPLLPLWLGEGRVNEKPLVPVKLELGEVTLMDGSITYMDEPAGIIVKMADVVIAVKRDRFNPKDQRDISVRSRKGELRWRTLPAGQEIEVESFRANLIYTPSELDVNRLEIATTPFSMKLSGRLPFQGDDEVNGDISLRVDLGRLPWILPDSGGEVILEGTADGKLMDPSFKGQVTGKQFRLSGRNMEDLEAGIRVDANGCEIRNAGVRYRGEDVSGTLSLDFKRGLPFKLEAGVRNYPLIRLAEEVRSMEFPLGGDVSTTIRASGNLSGEASSIALGGELNLPIGGGNMTSARFDLTGQYLAGDLRDVDLEISAANFQLLMNGSITARGPDLRVDATGDSFEFLNENEALSSLKGSLELKAEITGEWSDVKTRIDATVRSVKWENYSVEAVRTHIDVDSKGIRLPIVSMETGSSTLVGQMEIPWNRKPWVSRFSIETTGGRIEDIFGIGGVSPLVTGQVMGRLEGTLTQDGWEGNAELLMQAGQVLEEDFDQINLAGIFRQGQVVLNRLDIIKAGRRIQGKGQIKDGRFEAGFKSIEPIPVESVAYLRKLRVYLSGDVDLEVSIGGNTDGTGLSVDTGLKWDQITFEGRTWQGGTADFRIRDRRLVGEGSLLDGLFNARVEVDLAEEFPFSGSIHTGKAVDRDDLNNLLGVRIPSEVVSGSLEAEAEAVGILKNLQQAKVNGTIRNADLWIKGIHFRSQENIGFTYYPATGIRFIDASLSSGESTLAGTVLIAPGAVIEGSLDGNVDMQGFAFLKPSVDGFSGQSLVQLQVGGTLSEPVLNGSIKLREAKCTAHIPFDLPVSDLTGDLEIVGNRLRSQGITGISNGGLIRMEGDLILERFKPVQGELRWKAEAVPVSFPEGLNTTNRADIVLRFSEGLGVLRGSVSMDEGRYTRQINIDNLISLIRERSSAVRNDTPNDRRDNGGDWLTLDIEMETATPVAVDIQLLRGTATGNLHLQGTAGQPVLAGRMEMDEGTIEYRGHSFDVISGSVGFFNPVRIEPAFDFSARTEVTGLDRDGMVTDYTVDLLAKGVPEKFRLDLVSSPPLGEVDIVSLLTWGAVGEQAFASRSGLSAAEATLLLTRELKGTLETGVRQLTGFDRVVINPSSVTSSGERTTRIQVDKKLSDSFYLTYSTPVVTSAEQEVLLKYRISDSFSLIGEQTGEEDYGLDLDFQFQIP